MAEHVASSFRDFASFTYFVGRDAIRDYFAPVSGLFRWIRAIYQIPQVLEEMRRDERRNLDLFIDVLEQVRGIEQAITQLKADLDQIRRDSSVSSQEGQDWGPWGRVSLPDLSTSIHRHGRSHVYFSSATIPLKDLMVKNQRLAEELLTTIIGQRTSSTVEASARSSLALLFNLRREFEQARYAAEKAVEIAQVAGNREVMLRSYVELASALVALNRISEAYDVLQRAGKEGLEESWTVPADDE